MSATHTPLSLTPPRRGVQFNLNARRLVLFLSIATGLATLVQLALGVSLIVMATTLLISVLGYFSFLLLGPYNTAGWFALIYVLGNVFVALIAKTLYGQTLESNLKAPMESFVAIALSTFALMLAAVISRLLNVGRPLFPEQNDARTLRSLSWGSFAIGTICWYLNRLAQDANADPNTAAFGGFAVFSGLLVMAVIARTAMVLERTRCARSIDASGLLILSGSLAMGLLDDSKSAAALPVVGYFATTLFYRRGISLRATLTLLAGVFLFSAVIAPAIHIYRARGINKLPLSERIDLLERGMMAVFGPVDNETRHFEAVSERQFQGGYYDYFGGNKGQMILGRFASVQQDDAVIAAVDRQGQRGGSALWPALLMQMPSFLVQDKSKFHVAYNILVGLGLRSQYSGKDPTVPLVAQAYASYGIAGTVLLSFFSFLVFFLALKKFNWNLDRNVYAIFIFCCFIPVYGAQSDLTHYAGFILRVLPEYSLVFFALRYFGRLRFRGANHTIPAALTGRPGIGRT